MLPVPMIAMFTAVSVVSARPGFNIANKRRSAA
jgi:hypothetical protein